MILLDTHVLLWSQVAPEQLSARARQVIAEARRGRGGVAIAAISLWELAWLFARGRLEPAGPVEQALAALAAPVTVLPLTVRIAVLAAAFPLSIPGDPMDRLIAATARAHGVPLVTADRALRKSPLIETVW